MSQKKSAKVPLFTSYFVQPKQKAKSLFTWKKVDCVIKDQDGKIYYQCKNVRAPAAWSSTAIDIAASKYFRKAVGKENSIEALIERIGSGLHSAAKWSRLFKSKSEIAAFTEELKFILYSQKAAFNSPVWFNLGLKESYSVSSKSSHFAFDDKTRRIKKISDAYLRPQISACFIQSVDDSIEGIFELVKNEAKLFKYGSGTGSNFSSLRSRHEHLSSGGTSSGLISFLEVLDRSAGAIKSGGTTRRAAKMVCVDLDHPEIEDFISWKMKEEKKAFALIQAGYSSDMDGEAFKTVAGQNANNSIRIPDQFMKALANGQDWNLKTKENKIFKKVSAQKLWQKICLAAWSCADPGLQFDDTINRMHTCSETGRINASNPCSEYMFLDDSACNLASLNLVNFLDQNNTFKVTEYVHVIRTLFIAQEALVGFASYPTEKIAEHSVNFRPLGLGFANLGSMLMRMGLPYDSSAGRAWAGFLTSIMTATAYKTSAQMAGLLQPFHGYKKNKIPMFKVIKQHQAENKKIQWQLLPKEFKKISLDSWDEAISLGNKFGFRNAQATVIAPTGTIGLVMDCDTTGIEPDYSLIKYKKLSGGGVIKIINQSVHFALSHLGYTSSQIAAVSAYLLKNETLKGSLVKVEHLSIFETATGDLCLSSDAHLKMMCAVQPFLSGAISKTVNLPAEATIHDVSAIYKKAWQMKLKSISIYRDGSKFVQPLSSKTSKASNVSKAIKKEDEIQSKNSSNSTNTPKYPKCSECGTETILESGCYRCLNCGTTTACAS